MKNIEIKESENLVDYKYAIKFMEKKVTLIKNNLSNELIWFLEHSSVYTSGRGNYVHENFINNIPIYNTGRGGKITWHGPGQRIIYFIINLKKRGIDVRRFVNNIENFIITSLKELKINAFKKNNMVGIWTLDKNNKVSKISSLGLRVSSGIIYHGLSLNVSCDLSNFYSIVPCGLKNSRVTSINELNVFTENNVVDNTLKKNLDLIFN